MNYYEIEVHSARHNSELVAEARGMIEGQRLARREERRGERAPAPQGRRWRFHFPGRFRHSPA